MRLLLLTVLSLQLHSSCAFVIVRPSLSIGLSTSTTLFAADSPTSEQGSKHVIPSSDRSIQPTHVLSNILKTSFLAACVWTSSSLAFSVTTPFQYYPSGFVANAKEMASGSGSRVNKDPESLLRYGLPIPNDKPIRVLQGAIEDIKINIASKRKSAALDDVKKTRQILNSQSTFFANKMCRNADTCTSILKSMSETLTPLENSLKDASNFLQGSEQERNSLDAAYKYQDGLQKSISRLEENMVPANYKTPVPPEYSDLPQLQGRATVEFILQKSDGSPYVLEGKNYNEAKLVMTIDGYSSPITAGNFIDLVQKGFYSKMNIQRADGYVVQTGDPDGDAVGYVGKPNKAVGAGKNGERLIPLEVFVRGENAPFYESTLDESGKGGQATILPFSSYGAMGWAREEYDNNSGSSQFFWLLFDSDLTPAGKNMLDGRYPCFGYVIEGSDFLRDIKEDDVIVSTKILDGLEGFVPAK